MAITVEQGKALARKAAHGHLHKDCYDYGQGRYRFWKAVIDGPGQFGDSGSIVVMEATGQVITGSIAPAEAPQIYEVRDFATDEVVRPMEVSRMEYEQRCAEWEEIEAESEDDDGPLPEPEPFDPDRLEEEK